MSINISSQLSNAKSSCAAVFVKCNLNKVIFTVLFSFYLALSLYRFFRPGLLLTCVIMVLGLLAIVLLGTRIHKKDILIYIYAGFLAIYFLVSSLFVSRTEELPRIFLHIVSCTGIALLMIRGYLYSWGGYIVFYSLAVYFLILMFSGVNAESALLYTSWNGISMLMLVACISLYIILSMENKKIDLTPAFITLVISVWAIGRSGILSSVVLFLGILIIILRTNNRYIYNVIILLFLAYIFSGVLYKFGMNYVNVNNAINLYSSREMGPSVRIDIWSNYFNNLDVFRFIFGVNVFTDPWTEKGILGYNYHNSFISLHSKVGFMGIITMALMIMALYKYFKTNKLFFICLLSIILRWSTDYGMFFDSFDFIPFFFIFYYLRNISLSNFSFSMAGVERYQTISRGKPA